jgi:hypothetical protein
MTTLWIFLADSGKQPWNVNDDSQLEKRYAIQRFATGYQQKRQFRVVERVGQPNSMRYSGENNNRKCLSHD